MGKQRKMAKQGSTRLNLHTQMHGDRLFGTGSLHNFILFMCYAIQFHALNETDMSSSIWNYMMKRLLSSNQARNNEIMQRFRKQQMHRFNNSPKNVLGSSLSGL